MEISKAFIYLFLFTLFDSVTNSLYCNVDILG